MCLLVSGQKVPGHKVPKLVNIGQKVPRQNVKLNVNFSIIFWYHDQLSLRLYNFRYAFNKNGNICFLIIFLHGDFMSYVDQFGDFISGDFLTWILVCRLNVVDIVINLFNLYLKLFLVSCIFLMLHDCHNFFPPM